ncbi:MAG: SUMF1/EgtB/PvdO family nonheme iron enzyme, partial [Myxococcota bacterium]
MNRGRIGLAVVVALGLTAAFAAGCGEEGQERRAGDEAKSRRDKGDPPEPKPSATPSASVTATATATAASLGPAVDIPAGTFRAGSKCMDLPRSRRHELEFEEVSMGAFSMDKYPYPNEPGQPAKLDVTWFEAKELCEARGQRLCTEMEWERACKGEKSSTYPWGPSFKKGVCDGQLDHLIGQRETCESAYGMSDVIGLALEWTASDWKRGTSDGHKVVRGAREKVVSWLSARCTHSRKRDPNLTYDNVGFRCCRGPVNAAEVVIPQRKERTVQPFTELDGDYQKMLLRSMPKDHREIAGVTLGFERAYYWHPRDNEEMVIGVWEGKPTSGGAFFELVVFKVCTGRAWLTARMKGPVA